MKQSISRAAELRSFERVFVEVLLRLHCLPHRLFSGLVGGLELDRGVTLNEAFRKLVVWKRFFDQAFWNWKTVSKFLWVKNQRSCGFPVCGTE